jgi:hypothetical protein
MIACKVLKIKMGIQDTIHEPDHIVEVNVTAEQKWAAYNQKMVDLLAAWDLRPVNSSECTAVANYPDGTSE